jgi:glycerol-3-phosphate dehydrogenase subunit B
MQGEASQPHLRVTPLGTLRRRGFRRRRFPWRHCPHAASGVVGISGFADFQPHLAAASLTQQG